VICRVVEFSDEPAGMILYEGVFFSRTQAESYLTAHSHSVRHDNALHHHHKCKCTTSSVLLSLVIDTNNHQIVITLLGLFRI